MMKKCLLLFFLTWCVNCFAQVSANLSADKLIVQNYFSLVKVTEGANIGALLTNTALSFLGTPYVGATLEIGDKEQLVVNLRELDCTTFMENCVVLSRVLQMNTLNFDAYCKELQRIRYRDGLLNGYTSRLHYTSDWIFNNAAKGVLEDVTQKIGGEPFKVQLSFMSSHPDSYIHLKGQPDRIKEIRLIEEQVNQRENYYYYIPKEKIPMVQNKIQNGHIICFTTSIEGLDISHVGIAYWQNDTLTFIHASSTAKKVIINPESLFDYCRSITSNTGIMVLECTPSLSVVQ